MLEIMLCFVLAALLFICIIVVTEVREIWNHPDNKPVENPHLVRPRPR